MELTAKWKIDGLFKADANKVVAEIGADKVTPQEVLDKARDEKTELHKCFEWNDSIAAEKYRLQQAGNILRMLVIDTDKKDVEPVRAFHLSTQKNTYQSVRVILSDENEYQALLKRAKRELETFKRKYSTLSELESIFEAIESIL